ncbi:16448_t:CDS:2, partial [Acaulospora colombiana]
MDSKEEVESRGGAATGTELCCCLSPPDSFIPSHVSLQTRNLFYTSQYRGELDRPESSNPSNEMNATFGGRFRFQGPSPQKLPGTPQKLDEIIYVEVAPYPALNLYYAELSKEPLAFTNDLMMGSVHTTPYMRQLETRDVFLFVMLDDEKIGRAERFPVAAIVESSADKR